MMMNLEDRTYCLHVLASQRGRRHAVGQLPSILKTKDCLRY